PWLGLVDGMRVTATLEEKPIAGGPRSRVGEPVGTVHRPAGRDGVATIGVALAGFFAFMRLPVAPLPQVDYPTISVSASMPGASADTMAATVATPLERH